MVRSFALRITAWFTLLTLGATMLPVYAADATGATETHYSTAITAVYGSQYPITGHLDLEISASGTLRGYYHTSFQKQFIQVVGGRDGTYIWFDIGPSFTDLGIGAGPGGKLHIVGTMNADGTIQAQAYPEYAPGGSDASIAPQASPTGNDQYTFIAKPLAPMAAATAQP